MTRKCDRLECENDAACVVGLELYPFKATQEYYKTTQALTCLVVDLALCKLHICTLHPSDVVMEDALNLAAHQTYLASGTRIDVKLTRLVPVAFDHPHYLMLLRQQAQNANKG